MSPGGVCLDRLPFSGSSCLVAQADDKNAISPIRISVSLDVVELNSKDLFGLSGPVWP